MDKRLINKRADTMGRVVLLAPATTSRSLAFWPRVSVLVSTPVLCCCRVPSANGVKDGRNALVDVSGFVERRGRSINVQVPATSR